MSTINTPEDAVPITINGRTVDPQKTYAQDAERTNYITIRALEPLSHDSEAELQTLGVTIQEQVAIDTYLCRYEPSDLETIRAKPYISQVDVYRNKFKITQDLKTTNTLVASQNEASTAESSSNIPLQAKRTTGAIVLSDTCTVDILLHRDLPESADQIALALVVKACVNSSDMEFTPKKVRIIMDRNISRM